MEPRLGNASFPAVPASVKHRQPPSKKSIRQSTSTLFRRPRKIPCKATMLSGPVGLSTLRSRPLAIMRECLALMMSLLLMTRVLARRFNRYIFSIKYIMFFWRNWFGNIGARTWDWYHCFGWPCGGRISYCLSSCYGIRRHAFLYHLALRPKGPGCSPLCAPPVSRNWQF